MGQVFVFWNLCRACLNSEIFQLNLHSNMSLVQEFNDYRTKMNDRILAQDNKVIKRFWSLDNQTYQEGALDVRTKELLGLVASMVLRCDDCIKYHLGKSHELGVTTEQIFEVFAVANMVGGSICIPHTRRAVEYWEELQSL
jgi:AhpD family alkylhydroperoxidase